MTKIKVIGIGGGGNNAVMRMIKEQVQNIETYLFNTEINILKRANVITRNTLQIGKEITKGLGAGANEHIGEQAGEESKQAIQEILRDTDMLFLTAGMGGGTGTGAIPVIAKIAKKMGIMTIGIVTKPFTFEGKQRAKRAEKGIEKLKDNVNALIEVSNDKLLKVVSDKTSIEDAFSLADDILKQGVRSVTDLITTVGEINIDFADIKTIFNYIGKAYMGIGRAKGEDSIVQATLQAIDNPLTETPIDGARGVIFNITGSEDLSLNEINNAIRIITERVDNEANIIFGTVIDKNLKDEVSVTVIATGIDNNVTKYNVTSIKNK